MVRGSEEYRWSNYEANAWVDRSWLALHPGRQYLGPTPIEHKFDYREFFQLQLSEENLRLIRKAAYYWQIVGNDRFRQQIERKYGIRLGQMERR